MCRYGHRVATEKALGRRVREARFDPRLHPRDRDGEWQGASGAHLRRVVSDAQRLQIAHSKLRLRVDSEPYLAPQVDALGRARQQAEDELSGLGYHLTPMGKPVRIDQPIESGTAEERASFWDAKAAETRRALAATKDPMERAMLARHLQKLTGTLPATREGER